MEKGNKFVIPSSFFLDHNLSLHRYKSTGDFCTGGDDHIISVPLIPLGSYKISTLISESLYFVIKHMKLKGKIV